MYGDDFSHPQAEFSYLGMEDIVKCMNILYPNIDIKFSTVSEYIAAIRPSDLELDEYETDFLPY